MADEQGAIPEALGPLWRKVQQVHSDAMSNDWSVADYRAGMAATLGITSPAADRLTDTGGALEVVYACARIAEYHEKAMHLSSSETARAIKWAILDSLASLATLVTPKPPVDAGAMRERCAKVADEIAAECEEDEQACDADDRFGADRAFGGKIEARKIAKRIRNLPDAGEPL